MELNNNQFTQQSFKITNHFKTNSNNNKLNEMVCNIPVENEDFKIRKVHVIHHENTRSAILCVINDGKGTEIQSPTYFLQFKIEKELNIEIPETVQKYQFFYYNDDFSDPNDDYLKTFKEILKANEHPIDLDPFKEYAVKLNLLKPKQIGGIGVPRK